MNRHTIQDTIYCTSSQTKKAKELGAPIEVKSIEDAPKEWYGKACFTGMATCAKFPTVEQMIGWLEGQGFEFEGSNHYATVDYKDSGCLGIYTGSRKEATLAAIDKALNYLTTLRSEHEKNK